jgi:hypothetical protein
MLALLAVLVFTPARILPEPFLPNRLEPILPVAPLAGVPRATVTRGGNWRPGGLVRINYFYRFPQGEGPTHETFMSLGGFSGETGFNGNLRAVRQIDGIRQVVAVADLEAGIKWKWANISGPARVVTVTEFPLTDPPRWHHLPQLERAPLPPGYPPNHGFMKDAELMSVTCDPIIPRGFRTTFGIQVRLAGYRPLEEVWAEAEAELAAPVWNLSESKASRHFGRQGWDYGLVRIEILRPTIPNPRHQYEISLTYLFADPANGPRIED